MTDARWHEMRAELRRFVAARVPRADVDDVVQESLVRVHRGLPALRDRERVTAWIYQVTRNTVVDHLRARRTTEPLAVEPDAPVVDTDEPFANLARCVAPFLARLPPHYREAVELVELGGVSQVEAAARLGLPLSTLKSRVQRGRAHLRALLEACCAIELDARGHVIEVVPRCRCEVAA